MTRHRSTFASLPLFAALFGLSAPAEAQLSTIATGTGKQLVRVLSQHQRCTAATADGRLWCATNFDDGLGKGNASRTVRIYESKDAGKTWSLATSARTGGALRGSIATDVDGKTLHLAFEGRPGTAAWSSVYYAAFDTRAKKWLAADKLLARGTNANSQYLVPSIDVARDGTLVVSHYTHRQGPWAGQFQIGRDGNWTATAKVNVDTYGVRIDHQIVGDDVWFSYRTVSGAYGIRARRFDLKTNKWGPEGELQVSQQNTKRSGPANNSSCVAVDRSGKVWVLWACGASTAGKGEIWLSAKAANAKAFNEHYKVADDAGILGGNRTYDHFTIALDATGRVQVYFALTTEKLARLWLRFPLTQSLSPKLSMATGAPDDMFRLNGLRTSDLRSGSFVIVEDRSAKKLRMFVRGTGLTVPHVQGCAGSNAPAPHLTADSQPRLGASITFELRDLPKGRPGVFFIGVDNRRFGPFTLPLPLDALGFKGCALAQSPIASAGFASNQSGEFRLPFTYPNLPALTGVPVFWQAFITAPAANAGNGLLSNGVATIAQ